MPPTDAPAPSTPPVPRRRTAPGPLSGVTVLDAATLFAGPLAATMLGDFGADVIKIEHPRRRRPGRAATARARTASALWWKMLGRNKRTITLDLGDADGAEVLRRLVADADVLIENFRPGTLERWGLGPERAARDQPRPGDRPGHRLRADRPVRRPARLRHARRGDERLRRHHRRAGRPAHAAAVRARRRHRRAGHRVRDDDRALRTATRTAAAARWSTWRSSSRS